MTLISRLAGIERIEAQLEAQNVATEQHRAWEGDALSSLRSEAAEIKMLAQTTNGRVNKHDVDLAVIKEAEQQATVLQAARLRAEVEKKARRLSWRQGVVFVVVGAFFTTAFLAVLYIVQIIPHK